MITKLENAGYVVLKLEGALGIEVNAAAYGSAVDRTRLITIAVRRDLWKLKSERFKWPEQRPDPSRTVETVFREEKSEYLANSYVKEGFQRQRRRTPHGAHRLWVKKKERGAMKGEPWAPTSCYSAKGKAPSPTARGNSQWFETEDADGCVKWRRLSGNEMLDMQGVQTHLADGMSEGEKYNLAGNALPMEMAQAIGEAVSTLWDSEWFQRDQEQKKQADKRIPSQYRERRSNYAGIRQHPDGSLSMGRRAERRGSTMESAEETAQMCDARLKHCSSSHIATVMETPLLEPVKAKTAQTVGPAAEKCWMREIAKKQRLDPHLTAIRSIITDGTASQVEDKELARLRQESHGYEIDLKGPAKTEVLYKVEYREGRTYRLLCIPESMKTEFLEMAHGDRGIAQVHAQSEAMYQMLRNRYYWAAMRADCAMHVQRCNTCQRTAYGPRHHKGIPYVVPISAPFATVAFDIVGPIGTKATRKGNKYILTAIDYFTRYMEAFAIPDETP